MAIVFVVKVRAQNLPYGTRKHKPNNLLSFYAPRIRDKKIKMPVRSGGTETYI